MKAFFIKQKKSYNKSKKTLTQRVNSLEKELCNLKKVKQVKTSVLPDPKAGMVFRDNYDNNYVIINNYDGTHRLENVEKGITWNGNVENVCSKTAYVCSRKIYGDQGEDRLLYLGMFSELEKPSKLDENFKKSSYTFDEWRARGRHIMPGEKHKGRNKGGEATFTWNQTESKDERRERLEEWDDLRSDLEGARHDIY